MAGFDKSRFIRASFPPEIICKACEQVLNCPVQCIKCHIWLCQQCALNECSHKSECIHEYSEINKFLKNKVDELFIRCKYYPIGCNKIAKVGLVEKHEQSCMFAKLSCSNPECLKEENKKSGIAHVPTCPYSIVTCEKGCKKQMKLWEKSSHNCTEWLLTVTENLEIKNRVKTEEYDEMRGDYEKYKKDTTEKLNQANQEIELLGKKNTNLKRDLEDTKIELNLVIQNSEKKILEKLKQFQDTAHGTFDRFYNSSEKEFESLTRRMNDNINNYIDSIKKSIVDFNDRVQADSLDLFTLPKDMKEADKTPFKKLEKSPLKATQTNVILSSPLNNGPK